MIGLKISESIHLNRNEAKDVGCDYANTICSRISQGITGFKNEWDNGMIKTIFLGNYYGRHDGYDGSVFDPDGLCKTITASKGGIADLIEIEKVIIEDFYKGRMPRVYENYSPTLRADRDGLKTMEIERLGNIYGAEGGSFAGNVYDENGISPTLNTGGGGNRQPLIAEVKNADINRIGGMYGQATRWGVYDDNGAAPTLTAAMGEGGGHVPMITDVKDVLAHSVEALNPDGNSCRTIKAQYFKNSTANFDSVGTFGASGAVEIDHVRSGIQKVGIRQATESGVIECDVGGVCNLSYPNSETRRRRAIESGQVSQTIAVRYVPDVLEDWLWEIDGELYLIRIRKLTPLECWRLMGFDDAAHERAERAGVSATQRYKQAGNSICVPVLESLFEAML